MKRPLRSILVVSAGLITTPLLAMEFDAEVSAGATHTDNLTLAPDNEQGELVYRLEPSFQLLYEGTRITTDVDYRLQAFRYRDLEETEVFHEYDASIRADLVPDNLFFEVGTARAQAIRDPRLPIPQTNLPISGNRQDRDEYYASPSFQFPLGSTVAAQGDYRHTWVRFQEDDQGSETIGNEQGEGTFSIDNYRQGRGLAWAMRYNWRRIEYDEQFFPWEYQIASLELGFWITGNTRLFASGGLESAWDAPLDPALKDEIWEAGVSRWVSERLLAEFAVGERSFGKSWRGTLDFTFRRGSTSLSYRETPTTQDNSRIGQLSIGPDLPDDLLDRPGSGERFISNRLEWLLDLEFNRTTFSFNLFGENRTDRREFDGTPLDDETLKGLLTEISWQIGARTTLNIGGSWVDREFSDSDTSELIRGTAGVEYRIGARTLLSLEYEYTEEDGESELFAREYVANSITLLLTRTLF
jgi:hypothetical protein